MFYNIVLVSAIHQHEFSSVFWQLIALYLSQYYRKEIKIEQKHTKWRKTISLRNSLIKKDEAVLINSLTDSFMCWFTQSIYIKPFLQFCVYSVCVCVCVCVYVLFVKLDIDMRKASCKIHKICMCFSHFHPCNNRITEETKSLDQLFRWWMITLNLNYLLKGSTMIIILLLF